MRFVWRLHPQGSGQRATRAFAWPPAGRHSRSPCALRGPGRRVLARQRCSVGGQPSFCAPRGGPSGLPPGLAVARVQPEAAASALAELRPHLPAPRPGAPRGQSSTVLEVGLSFEASDRRGELRPSATALASLPCLRALVSDAMAALGAAEVLSEEGLCVLCRRYVAGQGLAFHADRRGLFVEDVYGCVLRNTSDRVLEFRRSGRGGEVLREYSLEEQPGVCLLQRGEARYKWFHGLRPLSDGERISVTWRWFSPGFMRDARGPLEARPATAFL
mmetsp:Transcript_92371/g.285311  ORF Transcript_92371/g.285311 Transcript_92371/m.285311 type:complete len:274 (+) Transcript_92371:65-886(+)